jgi:hypothetical protein
MPSSETRSCPAPFANSSTTLIASGPTIGKRARHETATRATAKSSIASKRKARARGPFHISPACRTGTVSGTVASRGSERAR